MSMPATVTVERSIAATPERVWEVITDIDAWPQTMTSITRVERMDDGTGFAPGTRWREYRRVMRREGSEEMEVTAVDPGASYTVEAENHGVHYTTVFTLTPDGDRSRLAVSFSGRHLAPPGIMARMLARLGMKAVRRGLDMDLADIAAAAERR
jgi:uncharacterized protein YndB with AHSA1/START domain